MTRAGSTGSSEQQEPDPRPGSPSSPPQGPPGTRTFSLEGRRAPGLYLIGWILSVGGVAVLLLVPMASSSVASFGLAALGAVALLLGFAAAAGSQIVERQDRHRDRYRGPAPLLVFGVVLVTSTIVSWFLLRSGPVDPNTPFGFLIGLLVVAVTYAAMVWLFAVRSGALRWEEMGWPVAGSSSARQVLRAIGTAVAVTLPATLVILVFGGILGQLLKVESPSVLPSVATSADALAVALAVAVVAPIGEELFFRGFVLTAWARDVGVSAAIVRSAVFFALIHVLNITSTSFGEGAAQALLQTAVILPLGVVLGWLFTRQGMVGAIAGHVTYNSFLLALLLLSSQLPAST